MKSFKKILMFAAASALTLTMGAVALTGCGGGKEYTFEAENAILAEPEGFEPSQWVKGMDLEEKLDGETDVTAVGYFSTQGMTITWKVNAAEEGDVTIKVYGSSTKFMQPTKMDGSQVEYLPPTYQPNVEPDEELKAGLEELPAENCGVALKVNGEEATMSGTLPGLEKTITIAQAMEIYGLYKGGYYTANVHLNKGENTIVLEVNTQMGGGFNVDKIVVKANSELTHTAVDNSDRVAQMG